MSNRTAALAALVVILLVIALPHARAGCGGPAGSPGCEVAAGAPHRSTVPHDAGAVEHAEPRAVVVEPGAPVPAVHADVAGGSLPPRAARVPAVAVAFPVLAGAGLALHLLVSRGARGSGHAVPGPAVVRI